MSEVLTHENAIAYAKDLLAECGDGCGVIAIQGVTDNADSPLDSPALDVAFTYHGGGDHVAVMTVWVDGSGKLYGEW